MRSGLLFKLAFRKPNIVLNNKAILGYTFLQSQYLEEVLKADTNNPNDTPIRELLKRNFSLNELLTSSFLKDRYIQHLECTQKCYLSLRNEGHKIVENIEEMANKNIIDIDLWIKIFSQVLSERFDQLQSHPQLDSVFKHMQAFFSRFDIKNSKFCLDKSQFQKLFNFKQNCTSIFDKKRSMGNIKLQTSIMNFFSKASSKTNINLEKVRDYYQTHLIDNLKQVLEKENSIVEVAKLQTVLDSLYLAKNQTRQIFGNKIKLLMKNKQDTRSFGNRESLAIATNWSCLGEMRQQYKSIFKQIFDSLLIDSPAALLQAIVTCHQQTPQMIDKVLEVLESRNFENLSRKPEIHRVLHILQIRNYDLSKYQNFIKKICKQSCDKLAPILHQNIKASVKSQCMLPELHKDPIFYIPLIEQKWVSNTLRAEFQQKMVVFLQTKMCRFDILFGFLHNGQIHVIQIPNLNKVVNKIKNYRGTVIQKQEMFKYYGVKILELKTSDKTLKKIIQKRDRHALIKEVKLLMEQL